jgi:hypothetical protein
MGDTTDNSITQSDNNRMVKIAFKLEQDEDGYPPAEVETVWAQEDNGYYIIANVPFFAMGVSYELVCKELNALGCDIEKSHIPGLFSVDIPPGADIPAIRNYLKKGEENERLSWEEASVTWL